jgi:hypothetical protein
MQFRHCRDAFYRTQMESPQNSDPDRFRIRFREPKDLMTVNASGAIRAGVFVRFRPSRSEAGLLMYSESLAGGDAEQSRSTLYKLKNAAGWKRSV